MNHSTINTTINYSTLGDLTHVAVLFSSLSFAWLAVTRYYDPQDTLFDPEWKAEGFCVTNKNVPYLNSHDMCFYLDSILGLVLGGVYLALRSQKGMQQANALLLTNIPGVIAHGLGHAGIGKSYRDGAQEEHDMRALTPLESAEHVYQLSLLLLFWMGMTKACFTNRHNIGVAMIALGITVVHSLAVPNAYGFTFVQTVLLLMFSVDQLLQDAHKKGLEYFTYPLMVGFPLTLVAWMESTQCSNFVREYLYGHLVYDAYIPIASLLWYISMYRICITSKSLVSDKVKQT